jgi:hypothetical protein
MGNRFAPVKSVELQDIQVVDALSDESICFVGHAVVNGERVGLVQNRGNGGDHEVRIADRDCYRALEVYAETRHQTVEELFGALLTETVRDRAPVSPGDVLAMVRQLGDHLRSFPSSSKGYRPDARTLTAWTQTRDEMLRRLERTAQDFAKGFV